MDKEEIIKYCLTLEDTFKDCQFPNDFESVAMKHGNHRPVPAGTERTGARSGASPCAACI